MTAKAGLPLEERIIQVLQHLGVEKAHFAGLTAADWRGLTLNYPDRVSSLTLICPIGMTSETLAPVASRLLIFTGDQGSPSQAVQRAVEGLAEAKVFVFKDYETPLFADVIADHLDEINTTMMEFIEDLNGTACEPLSVNPSKAGEIAGVTYHIEGTGPPLVLLPLGLARSQWEPLIPRLARIFCTIKLGGEHIGLIRDLEARASTGFKPLVGKLFEDLQIANDEAILDVGCGSGAHVRELARRTEGKNPITAIDYSPYMVTEATSIARLQCLDDVIDFREGTAEDLPFPRDSFDVVYSVTVMEEVDADRMLSEMLRVTKPGGRIGVIVRSNDSSWVVNLPIREDIKRKVEPPGIMGGGLAKGGCADRSLYSRFVEAGLEQLKMSAQLATFSEGSTVLRWEAQVIGALSAEDSEEWRRAAALARAEGTFFIAAPFHCAVGTRP